METTYLFDKEIRIFGIKRSGIHAISSWIYRHFLDKEQGKKTYAAIVLNSVDVSLKKHQRKKGKYRSITILPTQIEAALKRKIKLPFRAIIPISESFDLVQAQERLSNKKSSYNVLKKYYAKYYKVDEFSKEQITVLIYRSWANQLASALYIHDGPRTFWLHTTPLTYPFHKCPTDFSFMDLKTQYELEALEATNILKNKIIIIYDKWFVDIEYRKQIAGKLGLEFTDNGLNYVWKARSSFHDAKSDIQQKAQKMDVLNRYKYLDCNFTSRREYIIKKRYDYVNEGSC